MTSTSSPQHTSVVPAARAFAGAVAELGWELAVIQEVPTFCRMHLIGMDDELVIDLAIDAPPRLPTVNTAAGPMLDPLELAGQKLLALFGRAEPRDFADVFLLARLFGKPELLARASDIDPGFEPIVLASMMRMLDRLEDDELPVAAGIVVQLRAFFHDWASELEG